MTHSFEHFTPDAHQELQESHDHSSTTQSNDILRTTAQEKIPWNDPSNWIQTQIFMNGTQTVFATLNQINKNISDASHLLES
jgi:hypothetical protein